MSTPQAPKLPEEVYAVFCGGIEQATAQKVVQGLTVAMGGNVKHVHLLFQSAGGYVGDGVFLYNFFRAIPIELKLYNVGQISSAGVVAFLGAKRRKTTKNATFMLHRSTNSPQFATSAQRGFFFPLTGRKSCRNIHWGTLPEQDLSTAM